MELDQFQAEAKRTDRTKHNYDDVDLRVDVIVALLGIAGELGTLATSYKKFLRDGKGYELHEAHVREELGDILWYVATVASKFDLSLDDLAKQNLAKVSERWLHPDEQTSNHLDEGFKEQLPRRFSIQFKEEEHGGKTKAVMYLDGNPLGDPLTDNADEPDDYRFHDVFHLSFIAYLGWSPVIRKLMGKKRRSDPNVDEIQDGGRATVIEEGVVAYAFEYGRQNGMLAKARAVDYEVLRTIKDLTRRLEVGGQSPKTWEDAIQSAFLGFAQLTSNRGGWIDVDSDARTLAFRKH